MTRGSADHRAFDAPSLVVGRQRDGEKCDGNRCTSKRMPFTSPAYVSAVGELRFEGKFHPGSGETSSSSRKVSHPHRIPARSNLLVQRRLYLSEHFLWRKT
jgi:hypothetical protein